MLSPPCRCLNHLRHFNNGYFTANFGSNITSSHIRNYSKDKDDCCTNIPQTECKKVEPWPKEAAATSWRKECPTDPQPPNYDPYRIKIPNVVVPPLPSPDVKEIPNEDTRNMFKDPLSHIEQTDHEMQGPICNPAVVHPDNWKREINYHKLHDKEEKYLTVKLGYHGRNKYKYAFHEPWNPLDRMTLLEKAEQEEMNVPERERAGPTK